VIHHHSIGDARITGVIEYSGPTHDPAFLYPGSTRPRATPRWKANASWLRAAPLCARYRRLIVTVQLWVVKAGGNVIIVDTGVGNRKVRAAAARMDRLNTLVMPWLESIGAGPSHVTHVVMTHMHTDHVGWNTVEDGGKWVPTFPKARYLFPKDEFDYWKAQYDKGDKEVKSGSFVDSVLPINRCGPRRVHGRQVRGRGLPRARAGARPCARHAVVSHSLTRRGRSLHRRRDAQCDPDRASRMERTATVSGPTRRLRRAPRCCSARAERGALIMPMHLGNPYCGYVRRQGDGYAFEPAT